MWTRAHLPLREPQVLKISCIGFSSSLQLLPSSSIVTKTPPLPPCNCRARALRLLVLAILRVSLVCFAEYLCGEVFAGARFELSSQPAPQTSLGESGKPHLFCVSIIIYVTVSTYRYPPSYCDMGLDLFQRAFGPLAGRRLISNKKSSSSP